MESILWTIKGAMFLIIEAFIVGVVGTVLIVGVYEVVRDKIRESRILDQVTPETLPIISKSS
ncbi:MAG: hypothetical protein KKC18_13370 [Chloroflexi bacterium]|nr:hypothetical protein [Chloroflexota bacterium]